MLLVTALVVSLFTLTMEIIYFVLYSHTDNLKVCLGICILRLCIHSMLVNVYCREELTSSYPLLLLVGYTLSWNVLSLSREVECDLTIICVHFGHWINYCTRNIKSICWDFCRLFLNSLVDYTYYFCFKLSFIAVIEWWRIWK